MNTSAQTFDYIIVGGGTAGAVVAARLAEDNNVSVCLIEAGPHDENEPRILELKNWFSLLGTELDYDYSIEEQKRGNSTIRHSRGKMLGGCSSHNSCIAFRAPDYDIEQWEKQGAKDWKKDIQKYYQRVFDKVYIDKNPPINPMSQVFLDACEQMGFPKRTFTDDGTFHEGVGIFNLNVKDTIRQSSSVSYIHPLPKTKTNLTVMTEVFVNNILLDAENNAIGVATDSGVILAKKEIVISGGTFNSPKLLLLSGIGPAAELQKMGIPVIVDLPGVGKHLLDHPEGITIWESTMPISKDTTQEWEIGLFTKVDKTATIPDLMFHFGLVPFDINTLPLGYPTAEYGFSITPNVPRSKSEGFVKLRSANPHDDPIIDFQYFTDPEGYDERIMLAGVKLARKIVEQPALRPFVKRELAPGINIQDDEELSEYARRTANTVYHPAGTCKMGDISDPLSVVDPTLKVKGVKRLRVADASIFPSMTTVNPCITCMMIGEKCAEFIKQEHK